RIYTFCLGLRANWSRVFEVAARLGKAVEIDCYPDRQDLSFDLITLARDAGAMISLGTDSHHPWQLEFLDFGLAAAAAAGVSLERILNFKTLDQLSEWVRSVRCEGNSQSCLKRRPIAAPRRRRVAATEDFGRGILANGRSR